MAAEAAPAGAAFFKAFTAALMAFSAMASVTPAFVAFSVSHSKHSVFPWFVY
jgi:hypothetical protein